MAVTAQIPQNRRSTLKPCAASPGGETSASTGATEIVICSICSGLLLLNLCALA